MKRTRGFTLMEMLITIAVLSILTAIALPSYSEYVKRGQRSEARAALVQAAQFMERVRTERNSYRPGGNVPTLPTSVATVPGSGAARYAIRLSAVTANTFALEAQAVGSMVGDLCGNLSLDNTGLRGFTGGKGTMERCWER